MWTLPSSKRDGGGSPSWLSCVVWILQYDCRSVHTSLCWTADTTLLCFCLDVLLLNQSLSEGVVSFHYFLIICSNQDVVVTMDGFMPMIFLFLDPISWWHVFGKLMPVDRLFSNYSRLSWPHTFCPLLPTNQAISLEDGEDFFKYPLSKRNLMWNVTTCWTNLI